MEYGRRDLETLDRAQHRYRRREHCVSVEERGSEYADTEYHPAEFSYRPVLGNKEGEEGKDAAFAVIVGAHNVNRILKRNYDDKGPEDKRQYPKYVFVHERDIVFMGEAFTEGVERARPYVPENDAESNESKSRVLAGGRFQFLLFSIYPGPVDQYKPRI